MVLYGYCNGYFGRDSYGDKRIEVVGYDYIVCRNDEGYPEFLSGEKNKQLLIPNEWLEEEQDY